MENKKYCLKLDTAHEKVLNSEEKQQEMIEYLRGQLRRSRGVTTKKGDVAKIARDCGKEGDRSPSPAAGGKAAGAEARLLPFAGSAEKVF